MAASPSLPAPTSIRSRPLRCRSPRPPRCCARRRRNAKQSPQTAAIDRAAAAPVRQAAVPAADAPQRPPHRASDIFAALLSWIDGIGETGLDGHELRELGSKTAISPSTTSAPASTGRSRISASASSGATAAASCSLSARTIPQRPWGLTASIKPTRKGYRSIELEGRQRLGKRPAAGVSSRRWAYCKPTCRCRRACSGEIGPDGVPQNLYRPHRRRRRLDRRRQMTTTADLDIDRAEFKLQLGCRRIACCRCRSRSSPAATGSRCWAGRSAARGRRRLGVQDRRRHGRAGLGRRAKRAARSSTASP